MNREEEAVHRCDRLALPVEHDRLGNLEKEAAHDRGRARPREAQSVLASLAIPRRTVVDLPSLAAQKGRNGRGCGLQGKEGGLQRWAEVQEEAEEANSREVRVLREVAE